MWLLRVRLLGGAEKVRCFRSQEKVRARRETLSTQAHRPQHKNISKHLRRPSLNEVKWSGQGTDKNDNDTDETLVWCVMDFVRLWQRTYDCDDNERTNERTNEREFTT